MDHNTTGGSPMPRQQMQAIVQCYFDMQVTLFQNTFSGQKHAIYLVLDPFRHVGIQQWHWRNSDGISQN